VCWVGAGSPLPCHFFLFWHIWFAVSSLLAHAFLLVVGAVVRARQVRRAGKFPPLRGRRANHQTSECSVVGGLDQAGAAMGVGSVRLSEPPALVGKDQAGGNSRAPTWGPLSCHFVLPAPHPPLWDTKRKKPTPKPGWWSFFRKKLHQPSEKNGTFLPSGIACRSHSHLSSCRWSALRQIDSE